MPTAVALVSILAFAINDLLYRFLGSRVSPWVIMFTVAVALFFVSALICAVRGQRLLPSRLGGPVALLTFMRIADSIFAVFTFQYLPVSQAYLLIFTYPVVIVLFQAVFYRHFRWVSLLAVLLGVAGLLLVFYTGGFQSGTGVVLGLLCAVTVAGQILAARKAQDFPVSQLSANYSLWVMAVSGVGFYFFPGVPDAPFSPAIAPLLLLAFVNSVGSLTAVYAAQKLSSAHYAILCYLQIPLAIFLAWVFLGEPITGRVAAGLALLVTGSLLAQNTSLSKPNTP